MRGLGKTVPVWVIAIGLAATGTVASPTTTARADETAAHHWSRYFSEDTEYYQSLAADLVNAGDAHARGWTGAGVTVAVFDTGISGWSSEFAGKLVTGYDAVTGRLIRNSYDTGWHGTFVAGLIGAARNGWGIEGIAYDANLMSIRIANGDGSITLSDAQLAAGISYATGRATVFNNSWNTSYTINELSQAELESSMGLSITAWREAVAQGAIVVWAAGNDGLSNPGAFASLPTYWSDLLSGWVVAVSVDSSGVISSFSNLCGSAADWCIAAPGEDVVSVYSGGGLVTASGTSFSAPVVSAAAAVLQQMWPHLTNAQVLSIMFTTANKTGIYADSSIYGQGLLDMEAATRPVGTASVATGTTVSGGRTAAALTMAISSSPFGRSLLRALSATPVMVLDDYDRDFYANGSAFVTPTTHSYDSFRGIQSFGRPFRTVTGEGTSLSFAPATGHAGGGASGAPDTSRFIARIDAGGQPGGRLAIAHGVSNGLLLEGAAADTATRAMMADPHTLYAPFVSLGFNLNTDDRESWGGAYTRRLTPGLALTVAGFGTMVADRPSDWSRAASVSHYLTSESVTMGGLTRLTLGDEAASLSFDLGAVRENGTLLGAASDGALRLADGAATSFVGVSAEYTLSPGWRAFAGAELGVTRADSSASSLITDVGTLHSTAYRVGVSGERLLTEGDALAFTVSQPLRIESGEVSLSVPVGRETDGSILTYTGNADMAADGRELDLQAGYTLALEDAGEVSFTGLLRLQPDNVGDAGPEGVVMARYRMGF